MRYIGSKIKLLDKINDVIENNTNDVNTLCDIFSGTTAVSRYFKTKYNIISNDFLYFSYVIQMAVIKNNKIPSFEKINKYLNCNVFDYLDRVDEITDLNFTEEQFLIRNNYSSYNGRNYLTEQNAVIIDKWRLLIEKWKNNDLISNNEYYYLIACVIETVPFYSNISGTYGAFLKTWDKRALKKIQLIRLEVEEGFEQNECFNSNADELINDIKGDVLYIDPPYNERQYLPNYHLLETIARYDYPEIKGKTGVRNYDNQKSKWCLKKEVHNVFENMIKNANFRYIILSYNTDGIMKSDDIINIMKKYSYNNDVKVFEIAYTRFKSRELTNNSELKELLFFIEKNTKSDVDTNNDKQKLIKSPFNYIGGKTKILSQLLKYFPDNISTFVEPFVGGYNVGINLSFKKGFALDINKYLIELINIIKSENIDKLLENIKCIISKYNLSKENLDGYNLLRKDYNNKKDPLKLFVLLCYSFNHQIRFNNSGDFNTPFGKLRSSYNANIEKNLIRFANQLKQQNIEFIPGDFISFDYDILDTDSFVYCDPPYYISTGSYNDGTRYFGDWTEEKDKQLMKLLDTLDKKGIKFALSNVLYHKGIENIELTNWAKNYNIHFINANYNNSNYQSKAKEHSTVEVLITNY